MSEYGVTDKGFVLKRMDTILGEIHRDLSEGYGFNTRQDSQSFLNVLVTTFGSQIADLWETAQSSYYAKYPSTAQGINLDNATQYGGLRRKRNKETYYPLHCTGEDGSYVKAGTVVASNAMPQVRLRAVSDFEITRNNFNRIKIKVAAIEVEGNYMVVINNKQYSYKNTAGAMEEILYGLAAVITNNEYKVSVNEDDGNLLIEDCIPARSNMLSLSENLTTAGVTSIAAFATEDYGKITLPNHTVTEIITNISGFHSVENLLVPVFGRLRETDTEYRQSYLAKSAIRSSMMLDSITSKLLNNVVNVESAAGYENEHNITDEEGRPPHSIEIVVEGGDEMDIAKVVLANKAGGIQTYGDIEIKVAGMYGDFIPIRFNRPEYIYTWLRVNLYGNETLLPSNYMKLTKDAITSSANLKAGDSLITQLLQRGIYDTVSGVNYIDVQAAISTDDSYMPNNAEFTLKNVEANSRQKVLINEDRIEVIFVGSLQ